MTTNPYQPAPSAQQPPAATRPAGQIVLSFGQLGAKLAVLVIALGLVVIGVGWNGAASQTNFVAQFPYLISGGILGLALVVVGAALLVVQGAREDRARLEA